MPTTLTRSFLSVLVPGLVGVAPWLLALVQHTDATLGFTEYSSLANSLLFAVAAVAGTIFEGIGTFVEARWDRKLQESHAVKDSWFSYLARTFQHEPVGYRYISRLATTLSFELSMLSAAPVFIVGVATLTLLRFPALKWVIALGGPVVLVLTLAYFSYSASCTHRTLCETRRELNSRLAA
jgi:hypothetical protein